ncbi:MAG: hypothetical protein RR653_14825, partial [Clostridia bacterium]
SRSKNAYRYGSGEAGESATGYYYTSAVITLISPPVVPAVTEPPVTEPPPTEKPKPETSGLRISSSQEKFRISGASFANGYGGSLVESRIDVNEQGQELTLYATYELTLPQTEDGSSCLNGLVAELEMTNLYATQVSLLGSATTEDGRSASTFGAGSLDAGNTHKVKLSFDDQINAPASSPDGATSVYTTSRSKNAYRYGSGEAGESATGYYYTSA